MPEDYKIGKISLDEIDNKTFKAGENLSKIPAFNIDLESTDIDCPEVKILSLNGEWEIKYSDSNIDSPDSSNIKWFTADVPGSVYTALYKSGKIPDPNLGKNQNIAREYSKKTWWYKKKIKTQNEFERIILKFNGVANKCKIWINDKYLGSHEGMLSGFSYDITDYFKHQNKIDCSLLVKLEPIPFVVDKSFHDDCNASWKNTVVINNVYGWHYSNLPSLGIFSDVVIIEKLPVQIRDAFIFTKNIENKTMGLAVSFESEKLIWSGTIHIAIYPKNFKGKKYYFENTISNADCIDGKICFSFDVPDGRLWWPVDLGTPDLYECVIWFSEPGCEKMSILTYNFGIRTLEMEPLPGGPFPDKFNWKFIINGKEIFAKGSGWCTIDSLLDFSRKKYDRILNLCKMQHIQLIRAWGCGMPETDDFYDLCDLNGIMVIQEWPTAWDSHKTQPFEILEETVLQNTVRIRNHPSLVMYGGGNESSDPFGRAIDMMGKASIELDGTRPFHRGEPFGGSSHNYDVYWGRKKISHNLTLESHFFGEFGLASFPNFGSVKKYIPVEEINQFPIKKDSSFEYHTPVFGKWNDLEIVNQYAENFSSENPDPDEYIKSSQLAQITGVRHTLERARTRFPHCTGALYYKINDNFPGISWSSIDWYGVPKMSHYAFMNAFEPTKVCIIFNDTDMWGIKKNLPVFILDDNNKLESKNWRIEIKIYDSLFRVVKEKFQHGKGCVKSPLKCEDLILESKLTKSAPLFILCQLVIEDLQIIRTFYFFNYELERGCIFKLPKASLITKFENNTVCVKNESNYPAVGVMIENKENAEEFICDKGFLWIEPDEEQFIHCNFTKGIEISALNID